MNAHIHYSGKKLSKLMIPGTEGTGKRVNPLRTRRFWAIVLIPVIVAIAIIVPILLNSGQTPPAQVFVFSAVTESYTYRGDKSQKEVTSFTIPDTHEGFPVTEIGPNAFKDFKNLTSVTIPDTITIIYSSAFNGCVALTSIIIPNSVTQIRSSAFANCTALESVTLPTNKDFTQIDGSVFENCESLTYIVLPEYVKAIGTKAFRNCKVLTRVTIQYEASYVTMVSDTFDGVDHGPLRFVIASSTVHGYYWDLPAHSPWRPFIFKFEYA